MRPGIKITEETIGTGDEASKGKTVIINTRMLPLDEKDLQGIPDSWNKMTINLARRDVGPGIRYGVEGMRVGGRRIFIISPSLTSCHAPLRTEVALLEVRDSPYLTPEEYPPGKQMQIMHRGEISRLLPRWNLWMQEDGNYHASVTVPIPGLKWRHLREKELNGRMDSSKTVGLIKWLMDFPEKYPVQIVSEVFTYGGDSSVYAAHSKDVVCIHVGVQERGLYACNYYVPETSQAWYESELHHFIAELIKPRSES